MKSAIKKAFKKIYANDAALIALAEHNTSYRLEASFDRRNLSIFESGFNEADQIV